MNYKLSRKNITKPQDGSEDVVPTPINIYKQININSDESLMSEQRMNCHLLATAGGDYS